MPSIKRTSSGAIKRSSSYKKRSKPYSKKKSFYPRYTARKDIVNLGTTIPDTTVVRLKYCDDLTITVPNSPVGTNYLFRCNSIFDPDFTGTGHQPLGHDQWSQFYERYVVTKATLTATFKSTYGEVNQPTNVGVCLIANTSAAITSADNFAENNRTTYGYVCRDLGMTRITKVFKPNDFFGNENIIDDDEKGALFGANPIDGAYWQLKMWHPSQGFPVAAPLFVNVAITYECVLRERKELVGS
ncbi:hypothetical protein [Shewanella sp.]|uniref:hypothetical protein n=1 Tax=Shewanella sp. TaxID=50422 RepID=UPI0040486C66